MLVQGSIAGPAVGQQCVLNPPPFAGHAFEPGAGPIDPSGFDFVDAFPNLTFESPVFLTHAPDGSDRIFVVEKAGRIHVFPNDPGVTQTSVFLDVTSTVFSSGYEQGLLGLAFDPDYASNGYFYLNYTTRSSNCTNANTECTKIVRYRVGPDPDEADRTTSFQLLEYAQPDDDHNGGMIAFGPDGMLYIASGDGGDNQDGNAQNLGTRLGKLLRIDPMAPAPYIPPDNPFATHPQNAREIWHWGLRNPWRFSFDRLTGDLWIADVGQNRWEEVDFFPVGDPGGANLGWNVCEGDHDFKGDCAALGAVPPALEYSHTSGMGSVIIGGYVYRGVEAPSLRGAYVFGDAGSGRVLAWNRVDPPVDLDNVTALSSFGEDRQGELYALGLLDGKVYRLEQTSGQGGMLPALLSGTGLFQNVATLTPAPGVVEYDIRVPFWSDNAIKRRFYAPVAGQSAHFDADAPWAFPPGSAFVKHFEVPIGPGQTRRLETRVLVHQPAIPSQPAHWLGVTYRWNAQQTDAALLTTALDEQITVDLGDGPELQPYHYPAPFECLQCHNAAAGEVLGVRTAQMNRTLAYPAGSSNQLTAWSCAGLIEPDVGNPSAHVAHVDPTDTSAGLTARSRHWLDVNCAMCHRPGGPAPGGMDLTRFPLLGAMNAIGVLPSEGDLGIPGALRIAPGSPSQSVLWARVASDQIGEHMPPQSRAASPEAVALLQAWIGGLPSGAQDSDEDGFDDPVDLCPHVADDQTDLGGVGEGSAPDGIGDACQCGDVLADGVIDDLDPFVLRAILIGVPIVLDREHCNAIDPVGGPKGECDGVDVVVLRRALAGMGPGITPVCRAAGATP